MSSHVQMTLPLSFPRFVEAADACESSNHHLDLRPNGFWRMRVCLTTSRKVCGKRHTIPLKTQDVEVARKRRDKLLAAFKAEGLIPGGVRVQRGRRRRPGASAASG